VTFGSVVTVKDLSDDSEERYELVGPGEEDYAAEPMKILTSSPIAQGLMGKKVGDTAEVDIPTGRLRLEITAIDEPA
ncbi:MAG TPA: GreA/GreB family elongation factor, partial [Planctomycetaceae bacterium]